jgi:hypothetical protein
VFPIPSPLTVNPIAGFRRCMALLASAAVALAGLACMSTPADASLLSTAICGEASFSQPFARWGDTSRYELIPGGSFEGSLTGWSLGGGAQRVAGSEPFAATGSIGASSLELPAGAWAQSPTTCVNAAYPTFRFFARPATVASTLLVQVVYATPLGTVALPLGAVALGDSWQPTLPMLTGSVVTGALAGGTTQASLRFTALTGSSRVDDVFVDPRMR